MSFFAVHVLFWNQYTYLYINLRRSRDVFVPSFVCSFICYPRFSSLWPAFTLTVHINALYIESVHGREDHATWINSIPLKIATLLALQTLKWAYTFGTIRFSGAWRAGHFGAWPLPYGMSVQAPIRISNSLLLTSLITISRGWLATASERTASCIKYKFICFTIDQDSKRHGFIFLILSWQLYIGPMSRPIIKGCLVLTDIWSVLWAHTNVKIECSLCLA